jgi:hypothetical protein
MTVQRRNVRSGARFLRNSAAPVLLLGIVGIDQGSDGRETSRAPAFPSGKHVMAYSQFSRETQLLLEAADQAIQQSRQLSAERARLLSEAARYLTDRQQERGLRRAILPNTLYE